MNARIVGAVAQYESEQKAGGQTRKALELTEAGKVGNGGHRPFGYSRDRMLLVDAEADALRGAYAQVLSGRTLRSVGHECTAAGLLSTTGWPADVRSGRAAAALDSLAGRRAGAVVKLLVRGPDAPSSRAPSRFRGRAQHPHPVDVHRQSRRSSSGSPTRSMSPPDQRAFQRQPLPPKPSTTRADLVSKQALDRDRQEKAGAGGDCEHEPDVSENR